MGAVLEGKLPINHDIMTYLQDIFNLLPNMNVESLSSSLAGGRVCSKVYKTIAVKKCDCCAVKWEESRVHPCFHVHICMCMLS